MKRFLFYAYIAYAMITLTGCEDSVLKSDTISDVTVYGTVFDATSGEPLKNVKIEFDSFSEELDDVIVISSTNTGQDGCYEFLVNKVSTTETYLVMASKQGYDSDYGLVQFTNVNKKNGRVKVDLQLEKNPK